MKNHLPGPIVLLGSGETLPSSGTTHEFVAQRSHDRPRIVILETPAGFEPNSSAVAGRIKDFLDQRLQNYRPEVTVLPARRRDTPFSPDLPDIVSPILAADVILLGPGSPTYAVRQLRGSLAYQMIAAKQRRGSALFLSSAAALAFGACTLPVYEIYKVGEDLHWKPGLDFFAMYGLSVTVVPHWNNRDGGDALDTSRCYMGQARFDKLLKMLPFDQALVGIDENTSLILDFEEGVGRVLGAATVTLIRCGERRRFKSGSSFSLDYLGDWKIPDYPPDVSGPVWEAAAAAETEQTAVQEPPREVYDLVAARDHARAARDWDEADALRDQVAAMGWQIMDTPDGSELSLLPVTGDSEEA